MDPFKIDLDRLRAEKPKGAGIYCFLDKDQNPLYVGQSRHIPTRIREHARRKAWFKDVSTTLWAPFADLQSRLVAETVLILKLIPRYNRAIKLGLTKSGKLYELQFIRTRS